MKRQKDMKNKTPLIFFGASKFLIPTISMLNQNYELKLVITTEANPQDAIPQFCKTHGIAYESIMTLNNPVLLEKIKAMKAPLGILSYFRLLVPQSVIDIFPKGIVNIHPSLLPEYRGATPGMQALLDGKEETGVSLMLLDKELDHGPVLDQQKESIFPADTSDTLYTRLFDLGTRMLQKSLPLYLEGTLHSKEQDHSKATFSTRDVTRQDGFIDLNSLPSYQTLDRMIRAYYPWPGVFTKMKINDTEKIVKLLPKRMLQVEGKKPISTKDFMNGYPDKRLEIEKLFGK